jgi:hypothetical protein
MDGQGEKPGYPYGEMDALKWAEEFERLNPGVMDKDTMLGWFANAIMTGFDKAGAGLSEDNRGQIIATFEHNDTLGVKYHDMKPWKFWAAGKMIEMLGDQMVVENQMAMMQQAKQQAQALELLSRQPGGIRGPGTRQ